MERWQHMSEADYADYDYDYEEEDGEESGYDDMEELQTQHIDHGEEVEEEPAVQIDPVEAAQIESHLWAGRVEWLSTNGAAAAAAARMEEHPDGQVIVLAFSRCTSELEKVLQQSAPVRAAVERGIDTRPIWAGGATILVEGLGPEKFEEPVFSVEELRPWHVVLYHRNESELHAALSLVPVRVKKLKPRTSGRFALPNHEDMFTLSDHEVSRDQLDDVSSWEWMSRSEEDISGSSQHLCTPSARFQVVHTFIHFKPDLDSRSIRTW